MAFTWKLSELRSEFRRLIGKSTTGEISDADCNSWINDYYVNHFPHDAKVDEFDTWFTQATTATDDGEYTLSSAIDRLDDPVTINGEEIIMLYRDREEFFTNYPANQQYITSPTLVIGADNSAKVKHSDFTYEINNYGYSKSSSEVDLTGDDVPVNKYGAWSLRIDEDGTITVTAASDNSTGYDSPRLALEALTNADSDSAYMGYVTVVRSDAAFVPGTTELNLGTVTATYTDGKFETRQVPEAALLYGSKLYLRPKPDDIYEIKAPSISERPSALSGDTDAPADTRWGPMIARGTAILYLDSIGDMTRRDNLRDGAKYYVDSIGSDKIRRLLGQVVKRSF